MLDAVGVCAAIRMAKTVRTSPANVPQPPCAKMRHHRLTEEGIVCGSARERSHSSAHRTPITSTSAYGFVVWYVSRYGLPEKLRVIRLCAMQAELFIVLVPVLACNQSLAPLHHLPGSSPFVILWAHQRLTVFLFSIEEELVPVSHTIGFFR